MNLTGQPLVDKAIELAHKHHAGQFRADGKTPYVEHPRDVVARYCRAHPWYDGRGAAICWLHDVAEDTAITFDQLAAEGMESIIPELTLLTKWDGGSYLDYLLRLRRSGNQLALAVKLCDMDSNLSDLHNIPSKGRRKAMQTKYELARYILTHP